jgi:hypothetical protein
MIRVLSMIAVAGFILSLATISAAFAIGGPDLVARGGWSLLSWDDGDWHWGDGHRHFRRHGYWEGESGPQKSRTLAWSGARGLDVDLPADIRYVQADGPATVTVTGPESAVDRVVIRGSSIRYEGGRHHWGSRLSILVRAPNIDSFDLSGDNHLAIEGYNQDSLNIDVSGAGEVTAEGRVKTIAIDVSGSGDVDLGRLKAEGADVEISGAGDVTIAPTEWAKLDVSGMGDVRLLTHPPKLDTDVSGAGRVRQEEPNASPSPPPTPPAPPSPPKKKT